MEEFDNNDDSRKEPLLVAEEENLRETTVGTDDIPASSSSSSEDLTRVGSTVRGAIFNFTNTIVGAGAIGLGGAMASSGGIVSVLAILCFAYLTKRSLDLVVQLSVETPGAEGSYEGLARVSLGWRGWVIVTVSKFLYSFGCLVAYLVVMKDNLGPSLISLGRRLDPTWDDTAWWVREILASPEHSTWLCSLIFLLPLCLMRDMTPLANFSLLSIALMAILTSIVVYLFVANPNDEIRQASDGIYVDWLQIRPGFLESLGTFVFAFVSQHTAHLTFSSIRPIDRTLPNFARVTSWSIGIATTLTLLVGSAVYVSFWKKAETDMFNCYPDIVATDLAKLFLSLTMLLTFPLPFFTSREILIVSFLKGGAASKVGVDVDAVEPLIRLESADGENNISTVVEPFDLLLPGEGNQLRLPYHISGTVGLWMLVVALAISAPSLGDVLDLVGCASGTLIAFVMPGLFSLQIKGYTTEGALLLGVGGLVGTIGTFFSLRHLIRDMTHS